MENSKFKIFEFAPTLTGNRVTNTSSHIKNCCLQLQCQMWNCCKLGNIRSALFYIFLIPCFFYFLLKKILGYIFCYYKSNSIYVPTYRKKNSIYVFGYQLSYINSARVLFEFSAEGHLKHLCSEVEKILMYSIISSGRWW